MIQKSTLDFLKQVRENNHREWFDAHKDQYLAAKANVEDFIQEVEMGLNQIDVIESHKLYRIYRDIRFSKDKTPYKTYMSGYFRRAGVERRGGYFFSIEPGNSRIEGGFYGPNKEDLKRIRKEFEFDGDTIRKIVKDPVFAATFGELKGNGVKTAPQGFSRDHPNIELIRKKQFYVTRPFSDEEVLRPDFVQRVIETYSTLRPFFDYMSEVLTTDLNGEKIV
jgi:uncharacterized protein (TIGR02453 family)